MSDTEASSMTPDNDNDIEDVYRRYAPDLIRFATVLVGTDDAPDVVSSAVMGVLRQGFGSVRSPKAYLFQAVANQARNHKRSGIRRNQRERNANPGRNVVYVDEPYPTVRDAIERLSVQQRAVVYLTYWYDFHESDIAVHLGISTGSVRRHLARARVALRKGLDDEHE